MNLGGHRGGRPASSVRSHEGRRSLAALFDAMAAAGVFETATVIVHGDHGSRIPLLMPSPRTAVRLSETDLIGSYATLFAIRTPELRAHRDPSLRSIQGLFAELDLSRPLPVETLDILVEAPGGRKIGQPFIQRTMPDFGD